MKKLLAIVIASLFFTTPLYATVLFVPQGGTGASTLTGCLTGHGTGAITGSGTCGNSFSWPFTKYGTDQATSTTIDFFNGLLSTASSTFTGSTTLATTLLTNGTSTNFYVSGTLSAVNVYDTGIAGATCVGESATGLLGTSNCVSSVNSSGSTLTVSPTTGSVDVSLKLDHSNAWTALQTFANASSTLFSSQYASTTILCLSNDCRTAWPTSITFAWPWTKQSDGSQATSTTMAFLNGFESIASSTLTSAVITGGTINGTAIGAATPSTGIFSNSTSTILASTGDYITLGTAANPAYVASTTSVGPGNIASSTTRNGNSFNRASTTIAFAPWFENRKVIGASCFATSTNANPGGVNFQVGSKTNWTAALFCDANPRTYTFTAIQIAAYSNSLNLTVNAASSTPDSVSINIITQKVSD